jgi:hypothetical protein
MEPAPRGSRSCHGRRNWTHYTAASEGRAKDEIMPKTMALIGLAAAVMLTPAFATAQTGYGVTKGAPSTTTFERSWNHANESKERARAGAAYVRRHSGYYHPNHYNQ